MASKSKENWGEVKRRQRETVIERLAQSISRDNPDLFRGKALIGSEFIMAQELVRNAVILATELSVMDRDEVISRIMAQVSGYGPLQPFFVGELIGPQGRPIDAMEITEVMVNPSSDGKPKVFYGWRGSLHYAGDDYFKNNKEVMEFVQKTVEDAGRSFIEDIPIVDAWLKDGSRINAFGFKACPLGTAVTIRKSPLIRPAMPLSALMESGMFPPMVMKMIIDLIVMGHANFGIFGRTDSGKTTVARAAGEAFGEMERVLIGETSFELSFANLKNCLNLVEVGLGDRKIVTMSNICDTMNRSNPDRSIVGEIRGGEVVAAAEIAESTSGGFLTTGHAGGYNEFRLRLPKMFARGGMELKNDYVDTQISTMFHFMLFFDKPWDNVRTMTSLVEVTDQGEYKTIIRFDEDEFSATKGKVRRWVYEEPITQKRLSRLAFRGGLVLPEYEKVDNNKLLYCEKVA